MQSNFIIKDNCAVDSRVIGVKCTESLRFPELQPDNDATN